MPCSSIAKRRRAFAWTFRRVRPFGSSQAAVAIYPNTGNLWYGSDQTRTIALINKSTGAVLRYVDLSLQGLSDVITGMAFDASGNQLQQHDSATPFDSADNAPGKPSAQ